MEVGEEGLEGEMGWAGLFVGLGRPGVIRVFGKARDRIEMTFSVWSTMSYPVENNVYTLKLSKYHIVHIWILQPQCSKVNG
jgi:hypothetical protein